MAKALYNKWRPQKWDEVVGQPHIIQTLRNAVAGGRVVHAYLFAGPRGTGKTTVARLLAKAVNCLDPDPASRPCNRCEYCLAVNENRFLDLIEIDAASTNSVDDVRDLRDKINFIPNQGQFKVYIIDEVHMLSSSAFNALLKTLEEPPAHAIFILATTEIHKVLPTVLSRCQRHEFRRVPVDDILAHLRHIVEAEKLTAEQEALTLIARQSGGGMRDAISLLDQMASTGKEITLGLTQTILGTATSQTVFSMIEAILDRKPAAGMAAIHAAMDAGTDPRLLARQVVDYLRALLLVQMGNVSSTELAADTRLQAEKHSGAISTSDILHLIRYFNAAATELQGGWQPSLPLELALAEAMEMPLNSPAGVRPVKLEGKNKMLDQKAPLPASQVGEKSAPPQVAEKPGAMTPPESAAGISLNQVAKVWKQMCASLKDQNPSLNALLNSAKLLEIKDGILVLGFQSELLRSKTNTPEHLQITRQHLTETLGIDLPIRCVVTNAKQATPPNVKSDGMVAAALKAGGEIVDTQE